MGNEGRVHPFNCLYTHCVTPPEVIIYDFACQLLEYCIGREPAFFQHTRFFIDRFHYWNHKQGACSKAFQLTRILQLFSENTSICEQWHASVHSLKRHLVGMTLPRFMFTILLHLDAWNRGKLSRALTPVAASAHGTAPPPLPPQEIDEEPEALYQHVFDEEADDVYDYDPPVLSPCAPPVQRVDYGISPRTGANRVLATTHANYGEGKYEEGQTEDKDQDTSDNESKGGANAQNHQQTKRKRR